MVNSGAMLIIPNLTLSLNDETANGFGDRSIVFCIILTYCDVKRNKHITFIKSNVNMEELQIISFLNTIQALH